MSKALTVEGRDSACEAVDEVVEPVVGDGAVDVPVSFGKVTVEVLASDQDLHGPPPSDQASQVRGWTASGSGTDTDLELSEHGALAACEAFPRMNVNLGFGQGRGLLVYRYDTP